MVQETIKNTRWLKDGRTWRRSQDISSVTYWYIRVENVENDNDDDLPENLLMIWSHSPYIWLFFWLHPSFICSHIPASASKNISHPRLSFLFTWISPKSSSSTSWFECTRVSAQKAALQVQWPVCSPSKSTNPPPTELLHCVVLSCFKLYCCCFCCWWSCNAFVFAAMHHSCCCCCCSC